MGFTNPERCGLQAAVVRDLPGVVLSAQLSLITYSVCTLSDPCLSVSLSVNLLRRY